MYLLPEDSQYNQNMQHILTRLIKFAVLDGNRFVSCIAVTIMDLR